MDLPPEAAAAESFTLIGYGELLLDADGLLDALAAAIKLAIIMEPKPCERYAASTPAHRNPFKPLMRIRPLGPTSPKVAMYSRLEGPASISNLHVRVATGRSL